MLNGKKGQGQSQMLGMEDTYLRWPHRDDIIESNIQVLMDTFDLARVLGRTPATANKYRALIGLPT